MINAAGKLVEPEDRDLPGGRGECRLGERRAITVILTNQPGAESWPITGASFILMHKQPQDPRAAKAH